MKNPENAPKLNARGFGLIDFIIIGFVFLVIVFIIISNVVAYRY